MQAKTAHLKKLMRAIGAQRGTVATAATAPAPAGVQAAPADAPQAKSGKRFCAFLSHHKEAAAMEARSDLEGRALLAGVCLRSQ